MAIRCLTSGRMNMKATILHQTDVNTDPNGPNPDDYGTWVESQDPLTGEIVKVWVPDTNPTDPDDTTIPPSVKEVPCIVRGIVDGGIRVAGTTERFGDTYENIDYAKMWLPANVKITKNDRITNIKDATGHIRWLDEESFASPNKATVFNVNGVTPLFNAFNVMIEQFVLLERAEVSG